MSMKLLRNIIVEFDLPFMLRLVDSIDFETRPEGYTEYFVVYKDRVSGVDVPAILRFKMCLRDLEGVLTNKIATEHKRGILNYSVVQVWLDSQFFIANKIPPDYKFEYIMAHAKSKDSHGGYSELLKQAAMAFVNRFLDVYRDTTGFYWIRPINTDEVPIFRMQAIYEDESLEYSSLVTLGTGVALGTLIPPEQDISLREKLISRQKLDDLQKLAFASLDLYEKGDYWTAALTVEIFFEAKVARILRLAFKRKGLSDTEVDAKFERQVRGKKGNTKYTMPRSVDDLVKTYIPELTGLSVTDVSHALGKAYSEWSLKAKALRNNIAHGKTTSISEDQALDAIKSVREFLKEIEQMLTGIDSTKLDIDPP